MIKLPEDEYSKYDITETFVDFERMVDLTTKQKHMITVLKWLSGKKNIIQGIIATTSAFLAFKGIISPEDATYINAINLLIFGSASVATSKFVYNK